jgi:hypothetical protein
VLVPAADDATPPAAADDGAEVAAPVVAPGRSADPWLVALDPRVGIVIAPV